MINSTEPLSMAEAVEYIGNAKDSETEVAGFIKKFTKLSPKEAKELRKKVNELDLMKVNSVHITQMIDLLPENEEDLNKIFNDINLDEDETKKILNTIKEFK